MENQKHISQLGMSYFGPGSVETKCSDDHDPYFYQTFIGSHKIEVQPGDCVFWLSEDKKTAHLQRGKAQITSLHFATIVRGFAPENKTSTITGKTVLPYINGCSTKQIFPPDRPGDPTLQLLIIPPHSSEQQHHIHSTARCVYVLSGKGTCVLGMGKSLRVPLEAGAVCVFNPMAPHHFETTDESLVVLPVHVWSSTDEEHNHPMFNGTFRI